MRKKSQGVVLGIDFGTSNSSMAWIKAAPAKRAAERDSNEPSHIGGLVPIEADSPSMPTALFFDSEERTTSFGRAALSAYKSGNDGRLMRSLKSLLGSDLINETTEVLGNKTSYVDIISYYLSELKSRAQTHLNEPVEAVLMGRPVHFVDDDPERDAMAQNTLEAAAKKAGLTVLGFQFEPVAAALDFEQTLTHAAQVLIADIGGGTSDFTVIELGPEHAKQLDRSKSVLSTGGVHIAGTDFDSAISLRHVMPLLGLGHIGLRDREVPRRIFYELSSWHRINWAQSAREVRVARELSDTYADTAMHQRLLRVLEQRFGHQIAADVEQAKIEGSDDPLANVRIDLNYIENGLTALATGAQMRETLDKSLELIGDCAARCVNNAGLKNEALTLIYLTGGSSALPAFKAMLQKRFKNAKLVSGDLFSSVAAGLAQSAKKHAT